MTSQRQSVRRPTRGAVYGLVILFVSMLLLTFFDFWYTNHKIHQQCATINTVVAAGRQQTPTSEFGKAIVKNYQDLKRNYGC